MVNNKAYIFVVALLLSFNYQTKAMDLSHDPESAGRTIKLSATVPPLEFKIPVVRAELNVGVNANALFSSLGLVISVLGSILIYKGIEKTAKATCAINPDVALEREGSSLNKYGASLIVCGLLAMFHKKIHETLTSN